MDELLDHIVRMIAYVVGVAVGDDAAVVEHHNAVGDFVGSFFISWVTTTLVIFSSFWSLIISSLMTSEVIGSVR